ncbi:HflX-like GTP-binding protein [Streptomyces sp. NPDC054956]
MHRDRRRDHRSARANPGRTSAPVPLRSAASVLVEGAGVVLVGFFSGKDKAFGAVMDAAAAGLTARGVRVLARAAQRRGAQDGGVRNMSRPFSPRTLIRSGKVREVAAVREATGADAVVFVNPLTDHQRRILAELFDCPAVSLAEGPTDDSTDGSAA